MQLRIPDKRTFYRLAMLGLCGNVPHMWPDADSFDVCDATPRYVGIRCLRSGDKRFRARVHRRRVREYLTSVSLRAGEYVLSEIQPAQAIIQGELSHVNGRLTFYFSRDGNPMRCALQQNGAHVAGLAALDLLFRHMTSSDIDDIMDLMDAYNNTGSRETCIEFGVYPFSWGIFDKETIIWEIRQY